MRYFDRVTLLLRNETIVGLFQVEHQLSLQVVARFLALVTTMVTKVVHGN